MAFFLVFRPEEQMRKKVTEDSTHSYVAPLGLRMLSYSVPTACAVGYVYDRQLRWLGLNCRNSGAKPGLDHPGSACRASVHFALETGLALFRPSFMCRRSQTLSQL